MIEFLTLLADMFRDDANLFIRPLVGHAELVGGVPMPDGLVGFEVRRREYAS